MRSSFAGFITAQKALQASQAALSITGQNIANVNTYGYSRQRVDLYSSSSGGYRPQYGASVSSHIGWGVDIGGFSQIRDPYLDVRFRSESAKLGEVDAELSFLNDFEKIFDEISVDGINSQLQDFKKQLQGLAGEAGSPEFESIVKSSAESLMKLFNQYSSELDSTHDNQLNDLDKIAIDTMNVLMENISKLNSTIKSDELYGNPALELKDQRNAMLDELSQYVDINVTYSKVEIADGVYIDKMKVTLASDSDVSLIDDSTYGKIERNSDFPEIDEDLAISFKYPHDSDIATDITDSIGGGTLKGYLTMFNSKGEYDAPPNSDRGFEYYDSMLDSLASEFANAFNDLNKVVDADGNTVLDDDGNPMNNPLFESNEVDDDGNPVPINASNISIADDWLNGDYGITNSQDPEAGEGKNDNILRMIALFDQKVTYSAGGIDGVVGTGADDVTVFKGTFEEFFSNISTTVGVEKNSTEKIFDNYYSVLSGLDKSKSSVSGVSLDEEGMNIIKYQKSYNAAARFMTTLDEALDTIINNMGVVGR